VGGCQLEEGKGGENEERCEEKELVPTDFSPAILRRSFFFQCWQRGSSEILRRSRFEHVEGFSVVLVEGEETFSGVAVEL